MQLLRPSRYVASAQKREIEAVLTEEVMTLISERLTTPLQFEPPREIKASLQCQLAHLARKQVLAAVEELLQKRAELRNCNWKGWLSGFLSDPNSRSYLTRTGPHFRPVLVPRP